MDIAVVIPTYNRQAMLARALASVFAQSCPAAEVIVVDDGSTDRTRHLVERQFPNVSYIYQPRRGVSAARNRGIRSTAAPWIALLDSDDEWLEHKLERQQDLVRRQPGARFVHCDERWYRNGVVLPQKAYHRKSGGDIFERSLHRCLVSPSAALMARSIFDDYGYFDEQLTACEDYDLWLRITAFEPVEFVAEVLVNKFGGHPDQLSRTEWGLDRFRIRALSKLLHNPRLDQEKRRQVEQMLMRKTQIFANGAAKRGRQTGTPAAPEVIQKDFEADTIKTS